MVGFGRDGRRVEECSENFSEKKIKMRGTLFGAEEWIRLPVLSSQSFINLEQNKQLKFCDYKNKNIDFETQLILTQQLQTEYLKY